MNNNRQGFLFGMEEEDREGEANRADTVRPPRSTGAASPGSPDSGEAPSDLHGKTVYVIDAHALIYQVFHAMPEMSGPSGEPVGAIHGFVRDVVDLLEKKAPDYLFCAFDAPGDTFRQELYPAYKEQREAMPDDLRPQIPNIHRFLEALGVPNLSLPGYEADDLLATLAHRVTERGGKCVLVTSDKDCRQLIQDDVWIYNIRKDQLLDTAAVEADWGITPDQVIDFQALWGDPVDNIPGVPGIGKKTAADLLSRFGSLEGVYAHLDEISGKKRRENLENFQQQALISRELVRLDTAVPIEIPWIACEHAVRDQEALEGLCREFGFRSLGRRMLGGNFSVVEAPQHHCERIDSVERWVSWRERLESSSHWAMHWVTTAEPARWASPLGVAFCVSPDQSAYLAWDNSFCEPSELTAWLQAEATRPQRTWTGHDIKHQWVVLKSLGCELPLPLFDTMVADYLLDAGERNHSLKDMVMRYLSQEHADLDELTGSGKQKRKREELSPDAIADWAGQTAMWCLRLEPVLRSRLEADGLAELMTQTEMPLLRILAEMEWLGIKVDTSRLGQLHDRFTSRLEELRAEIYELAGEEFNMDSRVQLARILFEQLGLPVIKKTKTGPSTDADVLTELAEQHELPARMIEYRQLAKLCGTYVDALPLLVHPATGRIHTSFRQDVAATGRLSSVEPNLQNIPTRTREGREIRSAFVPDPADWIWLGADYSQIELRVLAHFSEDAALMQAFRDGKDIHTTVAAEIHGIPLLEVTEAMRRSAKAINFGIIYGQTPFGLAKALQIDKSEAEAFIDAYFEQYPGVAEFMETILEKTRKNGYVNTMLGRRRAVQGIRDPSKRGDSRQRNLPERIAINTVIQGSAADLIKLAMIRVQGRLRAESLQARMLLQIHDELVFETPQEERESLSQLVRQEMSEAAPLRVPLQVDLKSGPNWAECD